MMTRTPRAIPFILLSVLAAGCSLRGLAMRNLDWIARRSIERTFSPGQDQEKALRPELEACLEDLRREYLPRLRSWVLHLRRPADGVYGQKEIEAAVDDLSSLYEDFLKREAPGIGRFLASLEEPQIASLEKDHADHNRKRFLSAPAGEGEARERHAARLREQMEYWFGDLTDEQRRSVDRFSDDRYREEMQGRDETIRAQREMVNLLRSRPGPEALTSYVIGNGTSPYPLRPPSYREKMLARLAAWVDFLSRLDAVLEPGQRRHFDRELASLADDLDIGS